MNFHPQSLVQIPDVHRLKYIMIKSLNNWVCIYYIALKVLQKKIKLENALFSIYSSLFFLCHPEKELGRSCDS
jgi:hypothetical protein